MSMTPFVVRKILVKKLVEVASPATSEDEYKFVEVELVPVALTKVKFCIVDELLTKRLPKVARLEIVAVPVAIKLPPRYESPATESLLNGVVVPKPRFPEINILPMTSSLANDVVAAAPMST